MRRLWVENVTFWRATRRGFPKTAQKRQKNPVKQSRVGIFVKSTSGSTEICNFRFFGICEKFLAKNCPKTVVEDFGATRCGFHKKCPIFTI